MYIIYFDRYDKRHTINISNVGKKLLLLILTIISAGIFYLGYHTALNKNLDQTTQRDWVETWRTELKDNGRQIANARVDVQLHLNAFSEQMAKQQAHIARLDALAMYLIKVAKIDSDLFNFNEKLSEEDLYINENDGTTTENSGEFFRAFDLLANNLLILDNQLNLLQSVLKYQKLDRQTMVNGKPIKNGYISSYFGYRNHPISKRKLFHSGIDFVNKEGTPILAVASGVVSWASPKGGYGNLVEINHGDGYSTRYAHNSTILVKIGDLINKGDEIAKMGSTGRSTGAHVHFEVWRDGKPENPISYLAKK
jgi:murein DD-endopeptidase MepM/ murein hydrolase activator NlpD